MVVLILGVESMAHAQYIRTCGTPSPLSLQGAEAPGGPASVSAPRTGSFQVIPSICVSERYDSNVFYAPPTPGLRRDDLVTNVNPMLRIKHDGQFASGVLNVGGFNETYLNNPGLNFFGSTGNLTLNLDNSIKRIFANASLRVVDMVTYTPLPPGFINPAAGTSPSDPVNIQNVFAQGILAYRVNNLNNNGTVSTSYTITPTTSLNASFNHAMIKFGSSPLAAHGGVPIGLFDVTTQTGTVGGNARVSRVDTLNVEFSHAQTQFVSTAVGAFFKANSATVGWSRTLTPNLTAELGGGSIHIDPGLTTYAANAALVMNFVNNSTTLSYSRSAFPSFAGVPTVLVGDVFSLSAIQKLDQQWQLNERVSYSRSSGGSGLNALQFESYAASVDLYYWITKVWSTALTYDYMKFNSEFGSTNFRFDRHVLTLSVRASWE